MWPAIRTRGCHPVVARLLQLIANPFQRQHSLVVQIDPVALGQSRPASPGVAIFESSWSVCHRPPLIRSGPVLSAHPSQVMPEIGHLPSNFKLGYPPIRLNTVTVRNVNFSCSRNKPAGSRSALACYDCVDDRER